MQIEMPISKAPQARRSRFILVTIVKNGSEFTSLSTLYQMYLNVRAKLQKYNCEWSDNIGYELKKNNVIHLHTYVSCERSPFIKQIYGWNIQLKQFPIDDICTIIRYINKCKTQYDGDLMQLEAASFYYTQPISC